MDGCGYVGFRPPLAFDSLLAKVICTVAHGPFTTGTPLGDPSREKGDEGPEGATMRALQRRAVQALQVRSLGAWGGPPPGHHF